MSRKEREELRQLWEGLVEEFRASGLGQAQWCRENGYKVRHLHYWLAKFPGGGAPRPETTAWLPVPIERDPAPGSPVVVRVGRVAIDVSAGFDPDMLRAVVRALS